MCQKKRMVFPEALTASSFKKSVAWIKMTLLQRNPPTLCDLIYTKTVAAFENWPQSKIASIE